MKTVDQIREATKALRNGDKVEGFVYTKSDDGKEFVYVEENQKTYTVQGAFRIKVTEYDPNATAVPTATGATTKADKPPKAPKAPKKSDRPRDPNTGKVITTETITCSKCGKTFEKSIYTKNTQCPECRGVGTKALKGPDGKVITKVEKICTKCGKPFMASIYNPKVTECPECRPTKRKPKSGVPAQPRILVCARCGKSFEVNKFQPYWTAEMGCPDCRKKIKAEAKKAKKAAKAQATANTN